MKSRGRETQEAKREADVRVTNMGMVFHIRPFTEKAREWIRANVSTEEWQWTGDLVSVDWRSAPDIVDRIIAAGFVVRTP